MAEKLPTWIKTAEDYDEWKKNPQIQDKNIPLVKNGQLERSDYSKFICTACKSVGTPKKITKGSFLVEVALWLFFLVPGLIYSLWRLTTKFKACPVCHNPTMIPLSTPMGKQLLEQLNVR